MVSMCTCHRALLMEAEVYGIRKGPVGFIMREGRIKTSHRLKSAFARSLLFSSLYQFHSLFLCVSLLHILISCLPDPSLSASSVPSTPLVVGSRLLPSAHDVPLRYHVHVKGKSSCFAKKLWGHANTLHTTGSRVRPARTEATAQHPQ